MLNQSWEKELAMLTAILAVLSLYPLFSMVIPITLGKENVRIMYVYGVKQLMGQDIYKIFIQLNSMHGAVESIEPWSLLIVTDSSAIVWAMTPHPSDHKHTVIQLERNSCWPKMKYIYIYIWIYKWNTEEIFWCVSWWRGVNTCLQKGTPEFAVWITEFDLYIWRGRKPQICLLFSLFHDTKIPV